MNVDEAFASIAQAHAAFRDAQLQIEITKSALHTTAVTALAAVEPDDQGALVHRLYWEMLEIPVKTLQAVVGTNAKVRELAGAGPVVGRCQDCEEELRASTRNEVNSSPQRCKRCEMRRHDHRFGRLDLGYDSDVPPPDYPPEWDDEDGWELPSPRRYWERQSLW